MPPKWTRTWQFILGLLFVLAAILKAYDARAIANVFAFIGLRGTPFTISLLTLLGLETVLGVLLLFPRPPRGSVHAAVLLLVGFTFFLAVAADARCTSMRLSRCAARW